MANGLNPTFTKFSACRRFQSNSLINTPVAYVSPIAGGHGLLISQCTPDFSIFAVVYIKKLQRVVIYDRIIFPVSYRGPSIAACMHYGSESHVANRVIDCYQDLG